MKRRDRLRWKILLLAVVVPIALGLGTMWRVNRDFTRHAQAGIHDSLVRFSALFENLMEVRGRNLTVAARVIAEDPRFFAVLAVPGMPYDTRYRATVAGVARDFRALTAADVFEVVDRKGRVLASVGPIATGATTRADFLGGLWAQRPLTGIVVEGDVALQVAAAPILVAGRPMGTLLVGSELGPTLAKELAARTHSEVSFLAGPRITASTIAKDRDRAALLAALAAPDVAARVATGRLDPIEVHGGSQTYLTLVRPIPGSTPADRRAFVMQRSLEYESAFLGRIQAGLLQLAFVAALLAIAIGIGVSERITRPIMRLVRGAEEMEKGNYEFPLARGGKDEIGYLTERFQAMRRNERAQRERLEEVTKTQREFIDVAAHELLTPLTIVRANHEMLADASLGALSPHQQHALEQMADGLQRLENIATGATRMSQVGDSIEPAPCAVAALLAEAVANATAAGAGREVACTTEVEAGLDQVWLDGTRMGEAVQELVRNAIRCTPDGGSITVAARREGADLVLAVRDTGVGVVAERIEALLGRATIARDSMHHHSSTGLEFGSRGLGFGLAIVRGTARAHGGALEIASTPGHGSTFTIRVPFHAADRAARAA